MTDTFIVQGGIPLRGEVHVGGAKNATLPILAATLLSEQASTLHNVPDISDVHAFLQILEGLGCETSFNDGTVTVNPANLAPGQIPEKLVKHMRSSILLLGPLLGRFGEIELAFPGGCVLGKRSVHAHVHALTSLGAELIESSEALHLRGTLVGTKVIMAEASVTATENAIMAAVLAEGDTEIRWAAMEPHVADLCNFLVSMGAQINGIGTHTLQIRGSKDLLNGTEYKITPDYLEAGTMILAGVLTNGEITVYNTPVQQLDSFWQKLAEVGANFTLHQDHVEVKPHNGLKAVEKLQTAVFPGFPTDLQAPFTVLLTQCKGKSKVHETLFEGRLNYLFELERMGAKVQMLNPHQAVIEGATPLKGAPIVSCDIRAGAAMVLAALVAEGETVISDINYIDRGYEKLEQKLQGLGANFRRRTQD